MISIAFGTKHETTHSVLVARSRPDTEVSILLRSVHGLRVWCSDIPTCILR